MILLTNKKQCPACGRLNTLNWDLHVCRECGVRVFTPESSFERMKHDWLISFWVYFSPRSSGLFRGWAHSSHFDKPDPFTDPDKKFEMPGRDYGKRGANSTNSANYTPDQLGIEKLSAASN